MKGFSRYSFSLSLISRSQQVWISERVRLERSSSAPHRILPTRKPQRGRQKSPTGQETDGQEGKVRASRQRQRTKEERRRAALVQKGRSRVLQGITIGRFESYRCLLRKMVVW